MEEYKIYKREYNLEIYDKELLKKYGLEKAKYVYVGYTKQSLMERSYQWKWEVEHNRNINKNIVEFIKKLKVFYMNETNYKANVINKLIFFNASVIDVAKNETQAKEKEKNYTGFYIFSNFFADNYRVLSDRDSCLKPVKGKKKSYRFV